MQRDSPLAPFAISKPLLALNRLDPEAGAHRSQPLNRRMRPLRPWGAGAVAVLSVLLLGLAGSDDMRAGIRKSTHIPAEALAPALMQLASERGFQVVFRSETVGKAQTRGAEGELTFAQALTQLLAGTDLAFQYLDDRTITIVQSGDHAGGRSAQSVRPTPSQIPHPQSSGGSSDAAQAHLGRITIEAPKGRKALRLQVDKFVSSVVVQPWDDALYRWNVPICPLVAGLPKQYAEFVLERISKAAIDAHAPLAGRVCRPNLYVVATLQPKVLLKMWWARDRTMYNYNNVGIEAVEHFIHSSRPIRAWYNTYWGCGGPPENNTAVIGGFNLPFFGPTICGAGLGSRIERMSTGSNVSSAIVVIDGRQMNHITIGQMADYIALVGLADVRSDADPGPMPSILDLFGHETPPHELTLWDRALLYSLYNTEQSSRLEVPEMEMTMVRRIAP
jgi:Secretin and TonB N terminus short domain